MLKRYRVLAVSPGRLTGVAATDGPDRLRRFELIAAWTARSRAALLAALEAKFNRLFDEEQPDLVVEEALLGPRRTERALLVGDVLRHVAARRGVRLASVSLDSAERALLRTDRPTRLLVHRALAARFPQLARRTTGQESGFYGSLDSYYDRAFAALTLAVTAAAPSATESVAVVAH